MIKFCNQELALSLVGTSGKDRGRAQQDTIIGVGHNKGGGGSLLVGTSKIEGVSKIEIMFTL